MLYSRLISDNPYRLLGLGSCGSYRELLAKALSAEKAARVGLASEPGLADLFGCGRPEAGILVGSIRSLANNPVALSTYRLAWTLEYPPAGLREESLPGLCMLVEESFSETPTYRHLCFLVGWWAFLQAPSPATFDKTLSSLTEWYEDGAFDEHFTSVLARDNGDLGSARDVLYEAQNSLIDHILQVGTTHAEDRWNAGDTAESIALLRVICNSWPDPDQLHRALKRVADLGERERVRIENLCLSFEGWTTASPMYDVGEVRPILELAVVLGDYLPAATLWRSAVERRITQVATAMRNSAVELANKEMEYVAARKILEHVQGLPLAEDLQRLIAQDLQTLSKVQAAGGVASARPVAVAPILFTWNGIGTMMYGSTLFFVVLFIPIIPLGHYAVRCEGRGYLFSGSRPFERWHWFYLATSLSILCALAWTVFAPDSPVPTSGKPQFAEGADNQTVSMADGASSKDGAQEGRQPSKPADETQPSSDPVSQTRENEHTEPLGEGTPASGSVESSRTASREALAALIAKDNKHLEELRRQLDADKAMAETEKSDLDALQATLEVRRRLVVDYETRIAAGDEVDREAYSDALREHNELVDVWNARLRSAKSLLESINGLVREYNAAVQEHHRMVRDYNEQLGR